MIKGILLDMDGVIVDTEPVYDIFWIAIGERYAIPVENFHEVIKGTIMPEIMSRYFNHLPKVEQECIEQECSAYEMSMELKPVVGVFDFLKKMHKEGIPMALVTSSDMPKVRRVFDTFPIEKYFDAVVTHEKISRGKPAPDCYLLAAEELDLEPAECLVFEDSFNGIKAARAAGCRVVGVTTTNPHQELIPLTYDTISHFDGVSDALLDHWGIQL